MASVAADATPESAETAIRRRRSMSMVRLRCSWEPGFKSRARKAVPAEAHLRTPVSSLTMELCRSGIVGPPPIGTGAGAVARHATAPSRRRSRRPQASATACPAATAASICGSRARRPASERSRANMRSSSIDHIHLTCCSRRRAASSPDCVRRSRCASTCCPEFGDAVAGERRIGHDRRRPVRRARGQDVQRGAVFRGRGAWRARRCRRRPC